MNRPFNSLSNTRARLCLDVVRALRRDRSRSACPGRGAFSVKRFLGDMLGGLALFVLLIAGLFMIAGAGG